MREIVYTHYQAPETQPLIDDLAEQYSQQYNDSDEINRFPAYCFERPYGGFVVIVQDGQTVAGGGFMFYEEEIAEIKRVWTSPDHRRQGLGKAIMGALEDAITARGYRYVRLSTGDKQPEAAAMYKKLGYSEYVPEHIPSYHDEEILFIRELNPQAPGVKIHGLSERIKAWRQKRTLKKIYAD